MKIITRRTRIATLALIASLGILCANAQEMVVYKGLPNSKMKIDGTSTIHDWSVESSVIAGSFEVDPKFPADPDAKTPPEKGKINAKASLSIPITTLRSGSNPMDQVIRQAMNSEEHKKIEFAMNEMSFAGTDDKSTAWKFDIKGDLTINGIKKPASFQVLMERVSKVRLLFSGTTKVKMTDFKIQPPAPKIAAGAISTGDEVTLSWNWVVAKPAQ